MYEYTRSVVFLDKIYKEAYTFFKMVVKKLFSLQNAMKKIA